MSTPNTSLSVAPVNDNTVTEHPHKSSQDNVTKVVKVTCKKTKKKIEQPPKWKVTYDKVARRAV